MPLEARRRREENDTGRLTWGVGSQARRDAARRDVRAAVVWPARIVVCGRGAMYVTETRALAQSSPPTRLDGVRALLVDDDADLLEVLADHFERLGASVVRAGTVHAACDALTERSVDLLVCDLGLPDGSGHEVARLARSIGRVRAIVALTGSREEDEVDRSRAAGFQMHVTKPCDGHTLAMIAQILLSPPAASSAP